MRMSQLYVYTCCCRKEEFPASFLLDYGLWVPLQGKYHHDQIKISLSNHKIYKEVKFSDFCAGR